MTRYNDVTFSSKEGSTVSHLVNGGNLAQPAGGKMSFSGIWQGRPCPGNIANCALGKVLTYKNLIYLINLQFLVTLILKMMFLGYILETVTCWMLIIGRYIDFRMLMCSIMV